MKRVVLTLALAVIGLTTKAQRELYSSRVYIDTTAEKGSFDNPYIVDSMLESNPYVWFCIDNMHNSEAGKGMYGLKQDMISYTEELIREIGGGFYNYDRRDSGSRIEWEVIEENGAHYFMILFLYNETAKLIVQELSQEEHISQLKQFKKHYIKEYGEELVEKWLAY